MTPLPIRANAALSSSVIIKSRRCFKTYYYSSPAYLFGVTDVITSFGANEHKSYSLKELRLIIAILYSRVGTTPPADANCAGDLLPTDCLVARAFSLLSTLRQKLLQHAANVSAHFSVARALSPFAVAHRSSPLSTAAVIAAGRASVTFNRNQNINGTRA